MDNSVNVQRSSSAKVTAAGASAKKKRPKGLVLIMVLAFLTAVIAAGVLIIRAVFFPYDAVKNRAIRTLNSEYSGSFRFRDYETHGEYDFLYWTGSGDFFVTSKDLPDDAVVRVSVSEEDGTVSDNYLYYYYSDEIGPYYEAQLRPYFPQGDILIDSPTQYWMHPTGMTDLDDYLSDMTDCLINAQIDYNGDHPDVAEFEDILAQMHEDGFARDMRIAICEDGEEIMYTFYMSSSESSTVAVYDSYYD